MKVPVIDHNWAAENVCKHWKLTDPKFQECFAEISKEWQKTIPSSAYICRFVNEGILKICHTPEDFKRISDILLPYFEQIFLEEDGSLRFAQELFNAVMAQQIDSIDMFEQICRRTFEQNEKYRLQGGLSRDGSQYPEYISVAIREAIVGAQQ
ncbi:MAG: hypothetical protein ABID64_02175 [Nitrospirota bacterium]